MATIIDTLPQQGLMPGSGRGYPVFIAEQSDADRALIARCVAGSDVHDCPVMQMHATEGWVECIRPLRHEGDCYLV